MVFGILITRHFPFPFPKRMCGSWIKSLAGKTPNSQNAGTGATWRINTKILSTCRGRRHIVSPRAQLVRAVVLSLSRWVVGTCQKIPVVRRLSPQSPGRRALMTFSLLSLGPTQHTSYSIAWYSLFVMLKVLLNTSQSVKSIAPPVPVILGWVRVGT